ncbi:MAG: hypothetical protein U9N73_09445 [Candidatus Auribacterota bacterium]|nr:hypothetical protein [Candidatus Auribacterota bacterium]
MSSFNEKILRKQKKKYNELLENLFELKSSPYISPSFFIQMAYEALSFQLEDNEDLDNIEKSFMADWLFEYVHTIFEMLPVAKEAEELEELAGDPGTGYIIWLPHTEVTKNYI